MRNVVWAALSGMALCVGAQPVLAQSALVDWSGFYAGVLGGYVHDTQAAGSYAVGPLVSGDVTIGYSSTNTQITGGFGGLQAGYNVQHGIMVFGGVVDVISGGFSKSSSFSESYTNNEDPLDPEGVEGIGQSTYSLGPIASVRGKVGIEGPEGMLFFISGGVAATNRSTSSDGTLTVDTNGDGDFDGLEDGVYPMSSASSQLVFGAVVGAGVEAMLTENVSVGAEYAYYALPGTSSSNMLGSLFSGSETSFSGGLHSLRASLNYHF